MRKIWNILKKSKYIAAGDQKVKELRDKILPEMLEKAKAQGDTLASQQYQDMVQMVDRFEKKSMI